MVSSGRVLLAALIAILAAVIAVVFLWPPGGGKPPSSQRSPSGTPSSSGGPSFVETPFKYKQPVASMASCALIGGGSVPCPVALSYQETYDRFGLWDPGRYNDPARGICTSPYTETCQTTDSQGCNLAQGAPLGMDSGKPGNAYQGWCNDYGTKLKHGWDVCCLVSPYAHAEPRWNWIIGTCHGTNCGWTDVWSEGKDVGSQVQVNYVGSYQFDEASRQWVCQQESSFNMDGQHPFQDLSNNTQNWMPGPLPGGAANWANGFYPAGRPGVGAPAMAFMLSVERVFNTAWYVLNQAALDRGPAVSLVQSLSPQSLTEMGYSSAEAQSMLAAGNTWASARSGEWDLLESTMNAGQPGDATATVNDNYQYLFSNAATNEGSNGICLIHSLGSDFSQNGTYVNQSGGWFSRKFFVGDDPSGQASPRVFFCIIDSNGTTIFQIPTGEGAKAHWAGIRRKSADMVLPASFTSLSPPATGACADPSSFCAVFMPSCAASSPADVGTYNCPTNGLNAGWCGNFVRNTLVSTGNVWGSTPAFGGAVEWTTEMETSSK